MGIGGGGGGGGRGDVRFFYNSGADIERHFPPTHTHFYLQHVFKLASITWQYVTWQLVLLALCHMATNFAGIMSYGS